MTRRADTTAEALSAAAREWVLILRQERRAHLKAAIKAELIEAGVVILCTSGKCALSTFGERVGRLVAKTVRTDAQRPPAQIPPAQLA